VADALGQDLISAAIDVRGDGTVNFIIGVTALLPAGGAPEVTRYTWNLFANGTAVELDGKFTNYSRGACDPTSGQCPPPRDPGLAPFLIRGNCTATGGVTSCQELGLVHATFDPTAATITIPVPISFLNPTDGCSVIEGGVNLFGDTVMAAPSAFFTSSAFPLDTMFVEETVRAC
jgi:hypothetical protein